MCADGQAKQRDICRISSGDFYRCEALQKAEAYRKTTQGSFHFVMCQLISYLVIRHSSIILSHLVVHHFYYLDGPTLRGVKQEVIVYFTIIFRKNIKINAF